MRLWSEKIRLSYRIHSSHFWASILSHKIHSCQGKQQTHINTFINLKNNYTVRVCDCKYPVMASRQRRVVPDGSQAWPSMRNTLGECGSNGNKNAIFQQNIKGHQSSCNSMNTDKNALRSLVWKSYESVPTPSIGHDYGVNISSIREGNRFPLLCFSAVTSTLLLLNNY
mgnify:CR=1 FL=1